MAEERKRRSSRRNDSVDLEMLGLEVGNKPPQALDVEEAVIGSMLIEPNCVDEAMEELTPSCFYDEKHRMIFGAISALVNEHSSVDVLTVTQKLKSQGNLEIIGGPVALARLSQKVGAAAHVEYYIKILKQKCIQRELITASYEILRKAYDETVNVDDLIDISQTKIFAAIQNNVKRDVQEIGSVYNQAINDIERLQETTGLSGVPSGYRSIDDITFGWQPSDLIILAARPSVGKTAFVLNIARNAAVQYNMPVAFFSLEMPASQITERLLANISHVNLRNIAQADLSSEDSFERVMNAADILFSKKLYIIDVPNIRLNELRAKARALKREKDITVLMIDYIGLIDPGLGPQTPRHEVIATVSRSLKSLAREVLGKLLGRQSGVHSGQGT